ncbi:GNAT family N-acetyltransferase [Bacteroidota bacterium]
MELKIRHETVNDHSGIKKINDLAFGQPVEGVLIDKLRKSPNYNEKLSIVAEIVGGIIGHVLFFPIKIYDGEKYHDSLSLGPMAVVPKFQGKGIGGKLILHGIQVSKDLGFTSVVVLGHKDYYPRYGFKPASGWEISAPFKVPDEAFMARELIVDGLKGITGTVVYPKEIIEAV